MNVRLRPEQPANHDDHSRFFAFRSSSRYVLQSQAEKFELGALMSIGMIVLVLSLVLAIFLFAGLAGLVHALRGEVVEEDDLPQHLSSKSDSWVSAILAFPVLQSWLSRKRPLLFYRRDRRGRFRRIRRY